METQETIAAWHVKAIGPLMPADIIAAELTSQAAQLALMLMQYEAHPRRAHQVGEIVLTLNNLCTVLSLDLTELTDSAMVEKRRAHK